MVALWVVVNEWLQSLRRRYHYFDNLRCSRLPLPMLRSMSMSPPVPLSVPPSVPLSMPLSVPMSMPLSMPMAMPVVIPMQAMSLALRRI